MFVFGVLNINAVGGGVLGQNKRKLPQRPATASLRLRIRTRETKQYNGGIIPKVTARQVGSVAGRDDDDGD